MNEAISNAVYCGYSERQEEDCTRVSFWQLDEAGKEGFVECEAVMPCKDGQPEKSVCRMSYDEAMILKRLPSEDNTPVPLEILFGDMYDDVLLARARGIRGGLVKTDDDLVYRTERAENAVYLIRKQFRDVRAKTLQLDDACLDDITDVQVYRRRR